MKRTRLATSLLLTTSATLLVLQGCNTSSTLEPAPQVTDDGTGGEGTGGVVGLGTTGGSSETGGTSSNGNTGGTSNNGNTGGTSNNNGTGGKSQTGGTSSGSPTGGTHAATPTGGTTSGSPTGGSVSTPTGGTTAVTTAGGAGSGNTGKTVTIANGKGLGAMTGWGFVARGSLDPVTDPTCDTGKTAYPAGAGCTTTTNWNSTSALCVTGTIPALPATPTDADYTANFGINVGLGASETKGGTLGQSFTSITISTTGTPTTGLRAIVSVGTTDYCATLTPGTAIPFTTFNTACWDNSGTALTAAGSSSITQVQIQVISGAAAVTVTNLCLTGITFA